METSTIGKRLKYVRVAIAAKSQKEFGTEFGIRQTSVADYETGRVKPRQEVYKAICEKYSVNERWVLYGEGEITLKDIEDSFIHKFKTHLTVPVPFYDVKASAGSGNILQDYVDKDVMFFDERWLKNILGVIPENLSIIMAQGDSMVSGKNLKDDINDGDLLLVDNSVKNVINGKIFVITLNGELLVKKLYKDFEGNVSIVSNNPKYTQIKLTPFDDSEIIGRVIWNGNRETV